jgi:hypothetical protein
MDSRVILNRMRRAALLNLPEMERLRAISPSLGARNEVACRQRVSVIIPTFFNASLKSRSLQYLLSGLGESQLVREVILVSSDGVQADFADLRSLLGSCALKVVAAEPANRGASRNVGAAAATHEYLLFLDDDMLLRSWRCVDVILSELLRGGFECALFPRRHYARFPLLYQPASLDAVIARWRDCGSEGLPEICDPLQEPVADLPMLFCFPGCFMLIERDVFRAAGGFSDAFQGWGFEDTEFAVRAMRGLRVLNLFAKAEPLLHIDHPVSPYKSEEHGANYRKYFASEPAMDVHRLCRSVLRSEDFSGDRARPALLERTIHSEPFAEISKAGIPLDASSVEEWATSVAEKRMHALMSPRPEFIVLHGSRATGRAHATSDYDVLALYTGPIQEFFVTPEVPRVEVECAELDVFAAIAEQPWYFGLSGVLELAKLAQARLLWGNASRWADWRGKMIFTALGRGRLYWRVLAVGLHLHAEKYGQLLPRFMGGLCAVVAAGDNGEAIQEGTPFDIETFGRRTAALLDADRPSWRDDLKRGAKVFPLQIPEIWSALYCLVEFHHLPNHSPIALPGRVGAF